jgi:hypothetical protein
VNAASLLTILGKNRTVIEVVGYAAMVVAAAWVVVASVGSVATSIGHAAASYEPLPQTQLRRSNVPLPPVVYPPPTPKRDPSVGRDEVESSFVIVGVPTGGDFGTVAPRDVSASIVTLTPSAPTRPPVPEPSDLTREVLERPLMPPPALAGIP